jgi:hypothetical protein
VSKYLVVAHQTADCFELSEALQKQARADAAAEFTLLVPITFAGFLLKPEEGDELRVVARARRVGQAAAATLADAGVNVTRTIVGDELPVVALEEELIDNPEEYTGIVFSTLPEALSRWQRLDQIRQAADRFGLPVTHVIGMPAAANNMDPES